MKYPPIRDIRALFVFLKSTIGDEYRAEGDEESAAPSMTVTIGANASGSDWSYQTGDNSFTGGAYSFPHWAVITLTRRSNSLELARDVIDQIAELRAQ